MKIAWFSDFDLRGSGYMNISIPLCEGLVRAGHEVKAVALGYKGEEHRFGFSMIPSSNLAYSMTLLRNLSVVWHFDVLVVALDILLQAEILKGVSSDRKFKYVGIMPVESDPLCMSWAICLLQMDKALLISKFGFTEAQKAGVVNADYLEIGIDANAWRPPSQHERNSVRSVLGASESDFVVLTVADNQERKNLSTCMDVIRIIDQDFGIPTKYLLVTREHNVQGWKLRDYALEIGINNKVMIFERGLDFRKLWGLYAASDAFLLLSKAEGLGMPLLESMAVGLPIVATNCTSIAELCAENRGLLVDYNYVHRDPFGNGRRYWANPLDAANKLASIYKKTAMPDIDGARRYVEKRSWENAISKLDEVIQQLWEKDDEQPPG